MDRLRLLLGFASLALIVGSGILMTVYALHRQTEIISQEDWRELQATVSQLVQLEKNRLLSLNSPGPMPAALTEASIVSSPSRPSERIPINTADLTLLDSLPGIGPVRAQAILEARNLGGPFQDINDLHVRVPKIPAGVLEDISSQIIFNE